jgi:hypothetical protein
VHDIALKAAETDATKRALATFGKPFGLELYRGSGKTAAQQRPLPAPPSVPAPADSRVGFHPDDTTPIPRPSRYYGRRQTEPAEHFRAERRQAERAMGLLPIHAPMAPHRLRRWRLMLSLIPCPAASTRAFSPSPNPSVCATRRNSGSSHSRQLIVTLESLRRRKSPSRNSSFSFSFRRREPSLADES